MAERARGEQGQALWQALWQALAARRVAVLGDPMLDIYLYGETARVSREAPVLIVRKEREEYRLGGAANVAANLAALGVRTEILGIVGNDTAADRLRDMLGARGVDVTGLVGSGEATPTKTRVLAGAMGTSKQQVLRIDEEPPPVGEAAADALAAMLSERVDGHDAIILSDYGTGSVGRAAMQLAGKLSRAGRLVCVDSRYRLQDFHDAAILTPNAPEAEAFVGYRLRDEAAVERAGAQILEATGCRMCLLKQGRRGMTLFLRDAPPSHVDIVGEEEVADVTGAGDTVIATFAAALAAGVGGENAMRLANTAAGIVVTKTGTASASPSEIEQAAKAGGVELVPWDA